MDGYRKIPHVVRRHREDKHLDPLKNPTLVRRGEQRASSKWRRRREFLRRGALHPQTPDNSSGDEAPRSPDRVTEWELVAPPVVVPTRPSYLHRLLAWWRGSPIVSE